KSRDRPMCGAADRLEQKREVPGRAFLDGGSAALVGQDSDGGTAGRGIPGLRPEGEVIEPGRDEIGLCGERFAQIPLRGAPPTDIHESGILGPEKLLLMKVSRKERSLPMPLVLHIVPESGVFEQLEDGRDITRGCRRESIPIQAEVFEEQVDELSMRSDSPNLLQCRPVKPGTRWKSRGPPGK